jgi:dihydrolipoamide dehydrogenase
MMATEVVMPQMGESIAEGTITKWMKQVGDRVERDQPLLEVSTDKVDAEIPSPASGVLLEIRAAAGTTVAVNSVIGMIGEAGEKPAASAPATTAQPVATPAAPVAAAPKPAAAPPPMPPPAPSAPAAQAAPAPAAAPTGTFDYDLIIVGSGPGGYVAGIRAGQLGLKVAVVEKDPKLGGTCLHRGCIPTKALLHTAELLDEARHGADFGVEIADPRLDMNKTQSYKRRVVDKNAKGIEFLFKKNKVDGIRGFGRFVGPHEVEVELDGQRKRYRGKYLMVATGSVPRDIPIAPADGKRILNSDHILELEKVPQSLVVLGAGAVGTEFASIFTSFGSQVTLVEMLPRILPIEDEEVSAELERSLKKRGMKVMAGTQMTAVEKTNHGVRVKLQKDGKETVIEADVLLVAVGRKPVTENLGLEALGIKVDRGYIEVDGLMRTAVPHIYAIGDIVKTPWLAHVASAEGILAVEHMAGKEVHPINYDRTPSCTYCEPEVGSVGLTEAKAKERGYDVVIGKFPFSALGKASILGKTGGFVKVVRDKKYDELLGVHIIGPHATDLIAEAGVALQLESTVEELFRTMHAHPTLSEAVAEAAHAAWGHAIHA